MGTAKEKRYVPVRVVREGLRADVIEKILAFHMLTGTDTTSQISCLGNKPAWKTYLQHSHQLSLCYLTTSHATQRIS